MKAFFDTPVLVPVFYGNHIHHQASRANSSGLIDRPAAVERTA